jgi:hypothetical protein
MKSTKLSSAFQQVFFTAVCFTLLSGAGSLWLSGKGSLSPEQTRVFETCNTTWNLGITTVFGMLSAKAAGLSSADKSNDDDAQNSND